jgi:hypothetical protein
LTKKLTNGRRPTATEKAPQLTLVKDGLGVGRAMPTALVTAVMVEGMDSLSWRGRRLLGLGLLHGRLGVPTYLAGVPRIIAVEVAGISQ